MHPRPGLLLLPLFLPLLLPLVAVPGSAVPVGAPAVRPVPYHPHFRKVLECQIARDVTLTIRYQTATFDAAGANKMQPGQSWHLAGAVLETTATVKVGGRQIAPGQYALSVRKAADERWVLTLHKGRGFSRPGDDAQELATRFRRDAPRFEHLNIDVQPAGDKDHTSLHLDVRFDRLLASATIEVPKPPRK